MATRPPDENADAHAAHFWSTAIDWRRILTGLVIGIPIASTTYVAGQRVTEYAIQQLDRKLDEQTATIRREIDQLHADVREIRQRQDHGGHP